MELKGEERIGEECSKQGAEGRGVRVRRRKTAHWWFSSSSSSSSSPSPQAEIKGDIFTATEIENRWMRGGR